MHSNLFRYFAFLLLLPACLFAQEPKDLTSTIACWNLKGIPDISDARADRLAQAIGYIDPEVIILSEVTPAEKLKRIVKTLNTWGSEFQYEMPVGDQQPDDMKIAILYKKGVTVSNAGIIPGSNLGEDGKRNAVKANVTVGNFDFILIGLHLKSGRGNSERKERSKQCKVIAAWIEANTLIEKDVLVLGDYNMIPFETGHPKHDQENFDDLNPDEFLEFISTLDLSDHGTHISGSSIGNLLDGFAISANHTDEYIDGSLRIFPLNRAMRHTIRGFGKSVSDHLPLVAKFDTAMDDDD